MSRNLTSSQILRAKFGENKQNQQDKDAPLVDEAKDQQKIETPDLKADLIANYQSTVIDEIILTPANFATLPPQNLRPAEITTPAEFATQLEESLVTSLANSATQFEVMATVKGFLKLPNSILDELPEILNTNEQLMYIHLYRLSYGFGDKDQCIVSLAKLCKRTGLSERTVQKTIADLENKKLIKKVRHILGGKKERGIEFWVAKFATPAETTTQNSPANSAAIKDKALKYKLIKDYRRLGQQIQQILGERSISELCYEVELACKKAKIKFDKQIFNENITYITKK